VHPITKLESHNRASRGRSRVDRIEAQKKKRLAGGYDQDFYYEKSVRAIRQDIEGVIRTGRAVRATWIDNEGLEQSDTIHFFVWGIHRMANEAEA